MITILLDNKVIQYIFIETKRTLERANWSKIERYKGMFMNEEVILAKSAKDKIIEYVTYFFIYSFLGWIIETIYAIFVHGHFVKRGFLYGSICPIYGFGAVLLIIVTKKLYKNAFLRFLIATIAFTTFEYIVSVVLELVFQLRWWDYSNDFLNINGRVSLPYAVFWGFIGIVMLEKIHPHVQNKIQKITKKSNKVQLISSIIFVILLILDTVLSTIKYLEI